MFTPSTRPHVGLTHSFSPCRISKTSIQKDKHMIESNETSTVRGIQIKQKKERLWRITHQKCPATYIPMVSWFCLTRGANFQEGRAHVMGGYDGGRCLEAQLGPSLKDWIWKISAQSQTIHGVMLFEQKMRWHWISQMFQGQTWILGFVTFIFGWTKKNTSDSSFISIPWLRAALIGRRLGSVSNGQWFHRFIDRREKPVLKVVIVFFLYIDEYKIL